MRLSYFGALAPLLVVSLAEKLVISKVNEIVQKVLEENSDYVHYTGPADNSTETTSHLTTSDKLVSTNVNAVTTSYWYEELTKQGTAPETTAGYVVYRNVQDYGAKGVIITVMALEEGPEDGLTCFDAKVMV